MVIYHDYCNKVNKLSGNISGTFPGTFEPNHAKIGLKEGGDSPP